MTRGQGKDECETPRALGLHLHVHTEQKCEESRKNDGKGVYSGSSEPKIGSCIVHSNSIIVQPHPNPKAEVL